MLLNTRPRRVSSLGRGDQNDDMAKKVAGLYRLGL